MLSSLAFIILVGLLMAAISEKFRLPRIIGMLFTGILITAPLGAIGIDWTHDKLLEQKLKNAAGSR